MESLLEEWLRVEDGPDDEFIEALTTFTLPSWDHRTHLRVAWVHLTKFGRREGMKLIFERIKAFIANSPVAGRKTFHETMVWEPGSAALAGGSRVDYVACGCSWLQTYFWVHMVHFAIEATRNPTGDFKGFLVTNPQLIDGAWP